MAVKAFLKWLLALNAFAAALALASPGFAQTAPIEPITGLAIPLLPGEQILPFKNGCSQIVRFDQAAATRAANYSWYGGCRFGLADGQGYLLYGGPNAIGEFAPIRFRWGHSKPSVTRLDHLASLPSGSGRDASEIVSLHDPAVPSTVMGPGWPQLADRNGAFATGIIATRYLAGSTQQDSFILRMMKVPCPTILYDSSIEKKLMEPTVGAALNKAQQKIVLPICKNGLARLKSEGIVSGPTINWPSNPYEKVDYGYYYVVFDEHNVQPRTDDSYGAYTSSTASDVTLCPNPVTMAGCEAVWKPLRAAYEVRREEIIAQGPAALAGDAVDLERRFAPLDAVFKKKIAAMAARRAR